MSSKQNLSSAGVDSLARGIVGRVFTTDDVMHCVLGVDTDSGTVELSRRKDTQTSTVYMPLAEVCLRISEAA